MKRIEFIAPVEAMRGNLSGNQDLLYAENDNKAFEAPNGKQYARNYQPRFIGAKRASDNLKYFTVRTKNAVQLDSFTRANMALLGASGALFAYYSKPVGAIDLGKLGMILARKQSIGAVDSATTLRQFVMGEIRSMLQAKSATHLVTDGVNSVTLGNPWVSITYIARVSITVLVKFWAELSNGVTFTIEGVPGKGIAYEGMTFSQLAATTTDLNILGVQQIEVADEGYIATADGKFLTLKPNPETPGIVSYIDKDDEPLNGYKYATTEVSPE